MDGHVDDSLYELELGTLAADERAAIEAHLAACHRCRRERAAAREVLGALPLALADAPPPPPLRESLLARAAATPQPGRFVRFAAAAARLLDISVDRARALLDEVTERDRWVPGFTPDITLFHTQHGTAPGTIAGFVTVAAGATFPRHRHFGREWGLILQGAMHDDDGVVYRPGDESHKDADSEHEFHAGAGEDLVYLVVLEGGVDVGGVVIRAGDPAL